MNILLTNDDGYAAPGIKVLYEALCHLGQVTIVAPDRNRSGASSSLTLARPLRTQNIANNIIAVDGTPTDCVHLAITGLLKQQPDLVVSGINAGANLGDDVWYSGTVAAAVEGRFLGFPALAVSLADLAEGNYQAAAQVTTQLIQRLQTHQLPADTILNINVPDRPSEQLRGMRATRLGNRHKAEPVIKSADPRGYPIYWIGPAGAEQDAGPGTDFFAVNSGFASVTPIQVDLTRHALVDDLACWLKEMGE